MKWMTVIGAGLFLVSACGSDDSGGGGGGGSGKSGCGSDPWACGAGQTCWPVDTKGHLECIDAPTDLVEGTPCSFVVNQAQCAPHLYCFPAQNGATTGVCSPFCNQGTCQNGAACFQIGIQGGTEVVEVCEPIVPEGGTGGTDAGTGGTAGTGSGGTAGTSAGGTAGTSAGGTAGTSAGGTAGTSAGGTAGVAGSPT
jgi:hypothetical protein